MINAISNGIGQFANRPVTAVCVLTPPHADDLPVYQCAPVVIHTSITIGVILALVPRLLRWLKLSLNHST